MARRRTGVLQSAAARARIALLTMAAFLPVATGCADDLSLPPPPAVAAGMTSQPLVIRIAGDEFDDEVEVTTTVDELRAMVAMAAERLAPNVDLASVMSVSRTPLRLSSGSILFIRNDGQSLQLADERPDGTDAVLARVEWSSTFDWLDFVVAGDDDSAARRLTVDLTPVGASERPQIAVTLAVVAWLVSLDDPPPAGNDRPYYFDIGPFLVISLALLSFVLVSTIASCMWNFSAAWGIAKTFCGIAGKGSADNVGDRHYLTCKRSCDAYQFKCTSGVELPEACNKDGKPTRTEPCAVTIPCSPDGGTTSVEPKCPPVPACVTGDIEKEKMADVVKKATADAIAGLDKLQAALR